jgi:hypothetical protein
MAGWLGSFISPWVLGPPLAKMLDHSSCCIQSSSKNWELGLEGNIFPYRLYRPRLTNLSKSTHRLRALDGLKPLLGHQDLPSILVSAPNQFFFTFGHIQTFRHFMLWTSPLRSDSSAFVRFDLSPPTTGESPVKYIGIGRCSGQIFLCIRPETALSSRGKHLGRIIRSFREKARGLGCPMAGVGFI